ncbi:MAG: S8 family peptidase [Ignavibacterium sp.]|nr:S8 family peptidase [Ignavibacterium sp.]
MKNLFLLLLASILLSVNSFSQLKYSGINLEGRSGEHPDKIISSEIKSADQFSNKISPMLNIFLDNISSNKSVHVRVPESIGSLKELIFFHQNEMDDILLPVFIRTSSIPALESMISFLGGKTETVAGDIIVADMPVSTIRELALSSGVIYIEPSTISEMKIDISRVEAKVNQLHNGTGISRPYKGNGVVVGVIDSGIDWKHQDFKNTGGNRIQYLWDMSGSSNPPSGYGYGTEYTKAQLDANQCAQIDGDDGYGHGTHVAGTAAGNGGALSNYIGMAPESDIVFIKGFRTGPGFASTDVVNGCNYIFQKAQQLSKPAVINLSLGGHFGPHDGSSLYEQALTNLTGNGKIIVAAAGNEGGETMHLSYAVAGSSYNDSYETLIDLYSGAQIFVADMWYNSGSISVGLVAYNSSNGSVIGWTNGIAPGQKIEDAPFTVSGNTYGYVTIDATGTNNPNNGANQVLIAVDSHNGQINIGDVTWSVYTYGSGTFDSWVVTGGQYSTLTPQNYFKAGDNQKTVGMPSTAQKLICIGSYVTKTQWIDINGTTQNQPGNPVLGQISSFSSLGPSRDGRIKPDLVAPGEVIIAAYSSFLTQTPGSNILQGGKHQKMQGTSMATPHVTGVVALLLEKNPSLDYDQTVTILKNTTKKDGFTGTSANNTYGYGKLDAYNAFQNTSGGGGGTQVVIIQEGFDGNFPPDGWLQQITNSGFTWLKSNPQNNNFNQIDPNSTASAVCPWVAQNQNEWLITPAFNLGSGNASIEFYTGYSTQWLSGATIKLHISTNGGSNWTQIWTAENDGQPWSWRNRIIDISAYSNRQNLKLGWQYVGNDGDMVAIDGVRLLGYTGTTDITEDELIITDYNLSQNYPNPFNPATKISWQSPVGSWQVLKVFDVLGKEVAILVNEYKPAGRYEVEFDASRLSSGVYLYRLQAGEQSFTRKMTLVK